MKHLLMNSNDCDEFLYHKYDYETIYVNLVNISDLVLIRPLLESNIKHGSVFIICISTNFNPETKREDIITLREYSICSQLIKEKRLFFYTIDHIEYDASLSYLSLEESDFFDIVVRVGENEYFGKRNTENLWEDWYKLDEEFIKKNKLYNAKYFFNDLEARRYLNYIEV